MKDKQNNGDRQGNGEREERKDQRTERGLLSLGHAFYERYKADVDEENRQKGIDRKWVKGGAFASIIYTAITAVILGVNGCQAWIARDSEQRQLRAYISVSPGDVENFGTAQQHLRLIRRNSGQTPAYNVGFSSVGFAIIVPGTRIPTGATECGKPKFPKLATMFPGVDFPEDITIGKLFSEDQINSVRKAEALFVYYGNVCYSDAFGHPHYTNYCWMYKGDNMTAKHADGCLSYNDSN